MTFFGTIFIHHCIFKRSPAGSSKLEKDRNWRTGKDRTFLSLLTHHFSSPKLYLFLSAHLSRVTGNIYLFLSLCLVISIFSYLLVYPPTEVVSTFFSIFRDRPLVPFSIPRLSPHRWRIEWDIKRLTLIYEG